jgi:hypothetical protein
MAQPRLILAERTHRWANAWRRWGDDRVRLVELRSVTQCAAALEGNPTSAAAIEADLAGAERILDLLSEWRERFPRAHWVVLAGPNWRASELALREAGASSVVFAPRLWPVASRAIALHLARQTSDEPTGSLEEQVSNRLPWSRHATAAT